MTNPKGPTCKAGPFGFAHMDFIYAMWNGIIDERIEDAYIFAKGPKDLLKILED